MSDNFSVEPIITFFRRAVIIICLFIAITSCTVDEDLNGDSPYYLSIKTQFAIQEVDELIEELILEYDIAGASLAISKNEKMVYANGYGYADIEKNVSMQKNHVFRLGDLSKLFTASAIFRLIEDNRLLLSDQVFGSTGILSHQLGDNLNCNELCNITVDHLLRNMIRGWGEESVHNLISHYRQMNNEDFINYVLEEWPIETTTEKVKGDSHLGYFILGRVIEEVTGIGSLAYIKRELTDELGITTLDRTFFDQYLRADTEVSYYAKGRENQFVYSIAPRRDTDVGFISSGSDFLKFVCALDGKSERPDQLNNQSLSGLMQSMMKEEDCHLSNCKDFLFSGSIPGVQTQFIIGSTGVNVVLLLNGSIKDDGSFKRKINSILRHISNDESIPWQKGLDLF